MNETTGPRNLICDELISLIGYRGCGKTVVGEILAERLNWEFADTDDLVESKTNRTISEIFREDGEKTFRRLEARALDKALAGVRRVVSVGGGAVLARRNRKALRTTGVCVWLTAPADELFRRIDADISSATRRPSLIPTPGMEEVETLLQARLPVYEATADCVVSTAGLSIKQVADAVLDRLGAAPNAGESV